MLAFSALAGWLLWDGVGRSGPGSTEPGGFADARAARSAQEAAAAPAAGSDPPARRPRAERGAAACTPRARLACHAGDVYWFDSCDAPQGRAQDCAADGCEDARCLTPSARAAKDPRCNDLYAYGSCEGDVALACVDDRVVSYDCAASGERCVNTREGARCLPRNPKTDCTGNEPATCVGERVRQCVDGTFQELDCALRNAQCQMQDGAALCVTDSEPMPMEEVELCDGRDNDRDRRTDEGDVCARVPLVAFVPQGAELHELPQRMQEELEIVNRVYAPQVFEWTRTVTVDAELASFDTDVLDRTAALLSRSESSAFASQLRAQDPAAALRAERGLSFYIPVLFTERIAGRPPRSGLATLPNSRCGGVRVSDQPSPAYGLVVVSEARKPETLAHELGHYLGLCHTHEELARFDIDATAELRCAGSGDGICDTPDDPGPPQCLQAPHCELLCDPDSARPDARNIMSYYLSCRHVLSPEQVREAQRNLSLRRGWFRCASFGDCSCTPGDAQTCPAEMSCHPLANAAASGQAFSCAMDGPAWPGAPCSDPAQCSNNAMCLNVDAHGGRCVRACQVDDEHCTCSDVGLPYRVCAQDVEAWLR